MRVKNPLIAIPSYNRPYEIRKHIWWLKEIPNSDLTWKIFVRKEQFRYYSQEIGDKNLIAIDVTNFRETINAIGDYACQNGYDWVFKIDDDMSFKNRESKKKDIPFVFISALSDIVKELNDNSNIKAVNICKPSRYLYHKGGKFLYNKPLIGNYFIESKNMYMPKGLELLDDYYFTLKILEDGDTAIYCRAYENALTMSNSGGLQSYDRNEMTERTYHVLKTLYPLVEMIPRKGNENVKDVSIKKYLR
jgi:hypothetical protein